MRKTFLMWAVALIWVVLLALSPSTQAHHGFGGKYDRSAPIYLEGIVSDAFFGYPHAEIRLNPDLSIQKTDLPENASEFSQGLAFWQENSAAPLEIEFPPVRRFFDLDGRVKAGDRIAVIVLRNCEPPYQLRGQWIRLAGGQSVVRSGRMQTEVNGCL